MTAAELTARLGHVEDRHRDNWGWNWNAVKRVLEHLFEEGLVSAASRTESVRTPLHPHRHGSCRRRGRLAGGRNRTGRSAMDRLIDAAAQAHGIGTVRCFADYFRMPVKAAAAAVENLVDAGTAASRSRLPAGTGRSSGTWRPGCRAPPPARALLSPFDSLVFERRRLEELFGFHYRIEIYTPETEAPVRLLRPAVPAPRRHRGPGRPQGGPRRPAISWSRAAHAEPGRAGGHRRRTRRGAGAHGRVARSWTDVVVVPVGGPCAAARGSRSAPDTALYPLSGNRRHAARVSPVD